MRGSSRATGRALATSRSDPRETPLGAGTPQEKEGSPPGPRSQRLRPGRGGLGEVEEAPSKRRRKRLPSDPRKVDRDQPHVAPPKPVSLTKATAARAHHLVSPNPSLKHKTTTTQLLSFMKPSPGIKFGVAATTTRHDTPNIVTPRGDEEDYASRPLPTSGLRDDSQNLPAAGEPTADPDSARRRSARAASRGSGRRRQRAVLRLCRGPQPAPGATSDTRGLEAGGTPPKKKKSWQHCRKVGLTSQATIAAAGASGTGGSRPRSRPPGEGGNQVAERSPARRFPPPLGLGSRLEESLKRLSPRHTQKRP